ncbi:MAG: VWA domain-containing protein [Chthoniobacter sp.]|uniref:vWA domain-containing protein n=1 Tax=Chthoniobacter sp. TaxID=2510640 RepID=UPI0032A91E92
MTFLNVWAAGFAAVAPVIVLLYLLKLKRRPMAVSTLLFWQRILQESRRRAFFQRLRQLFSLLLHLLIFALILGALAHPTLDRQISEGASTVLIVDTRARMQATEPDGQTRFAKAKAEATNVVRQASALRQMAMITVDASARVVTPFTDDEKALRENLVKLSATDAGGDLNRAVELAEELLASRGGDRKIIVFTDRLPEAKPADLKVPLDFVTVGTARDNLAITRFATRPVLNSPQTSEVLLEVANFGPSPTKTNVELAYDGQLLDVKPLTLEPGAHAVQVFPTVPRPSNHARGWLTARLDTNDALAADNVAYAVLPVDPPKRILLITKGNWFLEKLLAADQSVAFELITPDGFTPALAAKFDAVIFDNFVPANFDIEKATGNSFFIKQTPFNTSEAVLDQPLVSDLDSRHPALRLVNLQNITLLHAAPLAVPKTEGWDWQAPIRSFDHALMITGERQGGAPRVAALALDIGDSDLPLRVAFPLLISNTIHWLVGEEAAPVLSRRAGEALPLAAGESVQMEPQTPWKKDAPAAAKSPAAHTLFQPLANGFYEWQTHDSKRWLAVNTFSEAESDLRVASPATSASIPLPAITLARLAGWPLWQYLAAAALLLFALEWWLFHRRRTE